MVLWHKNFSPGYLFLHEKQPLKCSSRPLCRTKRRPLRSPASRASCFPLIACTHRGSSVMNIAAMISLKAFVFHERALRNGFREIFSFLSPNTVPAAGIAISRWNTLLSMDNTNTCSSVGFHSRFTLYLEMSILKKSLGNKGLSLCANPAQK